MNNAKKVLRIAVPSRPSTAAMPIAAVNQIPATVVNPLTSSPPLLLIIVPAPRNPTPNSLTTIRVTPAISGRSEN